MSIGPSFAETQRRLREAFKCPACGKSTSVMNVRRGRGFTPEKISLDSHCSCAGGPAEYLKAREVPS